MQQAPFAPAGLRIRGAVIDGLNLVDARGRDGSGCPALVLERCDLINTAAEPGAPTLDARYAKLGRLSLLNCSVAHLDVSGAELMGNLELNELHGSDDQLCWVKALNIRVNGSVKADGATLIGPKERARQNEPPDYAFDLSGGTLTGSLGMSNGFSADGGVRLSSCTVGGDLWAIGATLIGRQADALMAQGARISGGVGLRAAESRVEPGKYAERFRAVGTLWFYSASVGTMDLTGAMLKPTEDAPDVAVLAAHLVEIRGDLLLNSAAGETSALNFEAHGDLNLTNANIGGSISAVEARLRSLLATSSTVGGDVTLHGHLHGKADFHGAHLKGDVSLGVMNPPPDRTLFHSFAFSAMSKKTRTRFPSRTPPSVAISE